MTPISDNAVQAQNAADLKLVRETMISRCLEANLQSIELIATTAAIAGEICKASARRLEAVGVYAPPTGNPYHKALAIEAQGRTFLAVLEYNNKPDPRLDEMFDLAFGKGKWEPQPAPNPPAVRQVDLYEMADNFDSILKSAVDGKWHESSLSLLNVSGRYKSGEYASGISHYHSIDWWSQFFAALETAIGLYDITDIAEAEHAAFATRAYRSLDKSGVTPGYISAVKAGNSLARIDGYFPKKRATQGLADFETLLTGS